MFSSTIFFSAFPSIVFVCSSMMNKHFYVICLSVSWVLSKRFASIIHSAFGLFSPTICCAAFPSILFYHLAIWPQHPFHSAISNLTLACFAPKSASRYFQVLFFCLQQCMINKTSTCWVLVNCFTGIFTHLLACFPHSTALLIFQVFYFYL